MDDPELEAIRNARMQQMQGQMTPDQQQKQSEQIEQKGQMINAMLAQIMDQDARARLNTLKLSKPEKAEMVQNMIINMAQTGRLGGKIDDAHFKQLLEQLSEQMPRSTSKVNFNRRRAAMDSDDDDDYGM